MDSVDAVIAGDGDGDDDVGVVGGVGERVGVEPLAPLCLSQGLLPLLGMLPRRNRQMQLTLENLMGQAVMTKETEEMRTPGLGPWRLVQGGALELDVVDSAMIVPDVAKRIHEADLVEDPMPMLMAISRWMASGRS